MSPSLLLLALACGPGGTPAGGDAGVVVSIAVEPAEVSVTSGPGAAGTADFEALATFDDGTVEPIELVSWELSNQAAGEIDAVGTFAASTENGALTTVTATHNGISGSALLTVIYEETIDEGGGEASSYDGSPTGNVAWLYPPDGVAVPRNIPSLTFMWEEVADAVGYRLSFTTATTAITVLTDENRWTAESDKWVAIAATNAGGQVEVEVRAIAAGGTLYGSGPRTIQVNRLDAQGSIYYWSTTDTGIVKVPIAAESPELYYAPQLNAPACVACHVIRGDRMGVTYGDNNSFFTGIIDVASGEPTELGGMVTRGYYNTMNPDGTRMISTSPDGGLNLWDTLTGDLLGAIDTGGLKLTQPDWSADGAVLVAVQSDQLVGDTSFSDGTLVVAPIDDDGNLGPITEVFDPVAYWGRADFDRPNVFYPSLSPDGAWIAFNYGNNGSYDNETASLWVISVDGGDPIELANANQGDDLANSWPHWGPLPDDDVYWLTYSSKRDYGDELTDGRPQIWVASFDPTLAEQGLDPTAPAFWLPNQDPETSNHTTFWGP